jgi:hypothetical protein
MTKIFAPSVSNMPIYESHKQAAYIVTTVLLLNTHWYERYKHSAYIVTTVLLLGTDLYVHLLGTD